MFLSGSYLQKVEKPFLILPPINNVCSWEWGAAAEFGIQSVRLINNTCNNWLEVRFKLLDAFSSRQRYCQIV